MLAKPNISKRSKKRSGQTLIQFALVATIFFMMLFGVIEYCRFIFWQNVVLNASREAARYAVVNITDTDLVTQTQATAKSMMFNIDSKMGSGYSCTVYLSDSSGNSTGSGDATTAQFGDYIAVKVSGTYTPTLPMLLKMNATYTISATTIMSSEAN